MKRIKLEFSDGGWCTIAIALLHTAKAAKDHTMAELARDIYAGIGLPAGAAMAEDTAERIARRYFKQRKGDAKKPRDPVLVVREDRPAEGAAHAPVRVRKHPRKWKLARPFSSGMRRRAAGLLRGTDQ